MLQTLDSGERSFGWWGRDGGSVAFALRCRCLPARSGPADGWCRGRGRRCRSRFQQFRRERRQRFRPAIFHRCEKAEEGRRKRRGTDAKDDDEGPSTKDGTDTKDDKKDGTDTKDEKKDSGLAAAVSNPVAAVTRRAWRRLLTRSRAGYTRWRRLLPRWRRLPRGGAGYTRWRRLPTR